MTPIRKAEKDVHDEILKQVDIVYGATAIALKHDGWGAERIDKLFVLTQDIWLNCDNYSIFKLLEDETGIELRLPTTNQSWHDVMYLSEAAKRRPLSNEEYLYFKIQQKKWVNAQVLGCIFIGLHRMDKWGATRLTRLMHDIDDISNGYGHDRKKIKEASAEISGVALK